VTGVGRRGPIVVENGLAWILDWGLIKNLLGRIGLCTFALRDLKMKKRVGKNIFIVHLKIHWLNMDN